jgi:hypothetical protein
MPDLFSFLSRIPTLIICGSAAIVFVTVIISRRLAVESGRVVASLKRFTLPLAETPLATTEQRVQGISPHTWEQMRVRFEDMSDETDKSAWHELDQVVERYTSPEELEGVFTTKPIREVLSYDRLVSSHYHGALYAVFPGILTGSGLLLTFTAILLALVDVRYDGSNATEPVQGIDGLINGLSGKFVSSIIGLLCSLAFTFYEKERTRQLRTAYDNFARAFEIRLPILSQARILLDIQRFASKQSVSISNISSEVVDRFIGAFRADVTPGLAEGVSAGMATQLQSEFRPTMEQMSGTLDELRRAIMSLEAQKQDSVTSEIRTLLESLQASLVGALGKMGEDFHQALSGAASKEFDNVQGTLESTRQVLSHMNEQFAAMQGAFASVIAKAEESTSAQMAVGREQTEALSALMNGLMLKLQETADHNVSSIRHQLTLVVSDLSEKVGALSAELMSAAHETAAQSRQTAQDVLQQTGHWSKATAQQLEQLVSNIEARSNEFRTAGQTLLKAHEFLSDTMVENGHALDRMAAASRSVEAYTNGLAGHTKAFEAVQAQQAQTAKLLREVSANVANSIDRHDVLLNRYEHVFDSYKGAFDQLDTKIAGTFKHIHAGMEQYTQAVEANFQAIVNTANQTLPHIADALSAQTQELEQHLEELNGLLGKGLERLSARAR